MSRSVLTATRPQVALQSYLDALLQEAAIELADSVTLDEFQAAVLEEQQRDLMPKAPVAAPVAPMAAAVPIPPAVRAVPETVAPAIVASVSRSVAQIEPTPEVTVKPRVAPVALSAVAPIAVAAQMAPPVAETETVQPPVTPPPLQFDGQPAWGEEPFECLLFDVAGLTLAVPLVSLGSIYPLAGQELTPLFGQPDWFLGILPCQAGNLKVLDAARWVMPDRYRDDFREGLQYVISVEGYEWGLAVHQVSRSIKLDPRQVKWRAQRSQRPWLAGTVIEHMCALLDVAALAELIASGATKREAQAQAQAQASKPAKHKRN